MESIKIEEFNSLKTGKDEFALQWAADGEVRTNDVKWASEVSPKELEYIYIPSLFTSSYFIY